MSDFMAVIQEVDYTDIPSWPAILKVSASLLVAIGIMVATYVLFCQSKWELLKVAMEREHSLRAEYVKKQTLAANLPAYKQQMAEIRERFDKLLRQLPEESEVPALLVEISEAGLEQGLVFQRFKPSPPVQKNFYVQLPIQISASGTYHQLAGFISAIANFQRVVTLGNLEIVRAGGGADTLEDDLTPLSFNADIYTYHFSGEVNPEDKPGVDEPGLPQ